MEKFKITANGTEVEVYRDGSGPPLLYLHGVYDLHTAQEGPFPFHQQLAQHFTVTAPAHPGCGQSGGIKEITAIEDLAFHYFDVLDALEFERVNVVGFCLGGWIAAEMAVRNPERVGRLVLIDSPGLRVPGDLIGDIFMMSLPREGIVLRDLRELLFMDADGAVAHNLIPDGRVRVEDEVARYKALTLAGRVGWEPPYLHNPKLRSRLHRIESSTLVIWGEHDRLVPLSHGQAYIENIPGAELRVLPDSGHTPILEQPEECAELIVDFLGPRARSGVAEIVGVNG